MNYINFNQIGGFPLTTNILKRLQTAFTIFNALGNVAGDKTIISGCSVVGSNVADGVVFVNNEMLDFKGGTVQTTVIIIEEVENLVFQNENSYPVVKTRFMTFGTGVGQMNWADFKRPVTTRETPANLSIRLAEIEKKVAVFQSGGGMVLWNKPANEIPEGWAEVEDWRGRIPVGTDASQIEFSTIGKMGGEKEVALVKNNIPPLDLVIPVSSAENSGGDYRFINATDLEFVENKTYEGVVNKANTSPTKVKILNPYRTVYFIEYIES